MYSSFSPLFIGSLADSVTLFSSSPRSALSFSPLFIGSLADSSGGATPVRAITRVSVPYSSGVWLTGSPAQGRVPPAHSFQSPIHRESG